MPTVRELFSRIIGTQNVGPAKDDEVAALSMAKELETFYERRIRDLVPVTQPLVLVSQIQRSGGTLISQLFDHHFQCHAHPYELYIGHPNKSTWPALDLTQSPEEWFRMLEESPAAKHYARGYTKHSNNADDEGDAFPFQFLTNLQQRIFHSFFKESKPASVRDILNAYMTSYFNAWIDNQNLYAEPKRIVTGFVPRMNFSMSNIDQFFDAYPDGKFISVVRDPRSWFVSARKHDPKDYPDLESAIQLWMQSTQSTLAILEKYRDKVMVIQFEQLLTDTAGIMMRLATFLDIDFSRILVQPTFNGRLIRAASSFRADAPGVLSAPIHRREMLSPAEIEQIESMVGGLWSDALDAAEDSLKTVRAA